MGVETICRMFLTRFLHVLHLSIFLLLFLLVHVPELKLCLGIDILVVSPALKREACFRALTV